MALSDDDVREILRIIEESGVEELRIETDDFKLEVRRGGAPFPPGAAPPPSQTPAAAAAEPEPGDGGDSEIVTAPMLGLFYQAEAPGEPPFVAVGDRVEEDTVVGLIEVMKLMNSIPAGVAGTVVEVCAENGKLVEYGQPLIRVATER